MFRRALSCIIMVAVSFHILSGLASSSMPKTKVCIPLSLGDVGIDDLAVEIDKRLSLVGKNDGINGRLLPLSRKKFRSGTA